MFETRLKAIAGVLAIGLAIVSGRLIELQVINAAVYREQADRMLLRPAQWLPFVRGRILDRTGHVLASDDPDWEVCVDYDVLALTPETFVKCVRAYALKRRYGPGLSSAEVETRFRDEIGRMWADLARLSGRPEAELRAAGDRICRRVQALRQARAAVLGFDDPVREEEIPHAVSDGLNDQQQIAARLQLDAYPWLSVRSGVRRSYHDAFTLAHVVGRTALISAEDKRADAAADDPLRRLMPDDLVGRSGVEYVAEGMLRGVRGRLVRSFGGDVLENTPAVDGQDVRLTLRLDLQDRLYEELEASLRNNPLSSGGAIVVLDVSTRELLALVSYPAYNPNRFSEDYARLRADTRRMPLRFRAVANAYAPGSIVKPLACLAGLSSGKMTTATAFHCDGGPYDPSHPEHFRCWEVIGSGTRRAHLDQTVETAITHSCNVFMYHVGDLIGVSGLTSFFDMVGFGRTSGTWLLEESAGVNPTPEWIQRRRPLQGGDVWNYTIGQGELLVTPVQAANLMAVYASGVYKPVSLIRGTHDDHEWRLPAPPGAWEAIRRGIYRVVNDPEGTAYNYARIDPAETGYVICGKTGSATVEKPWPTAYRVKFRAADGRDTFALVPAGDERQALEVFRAEHRGVEVGREAVEVAEVWPNLPPQHGAKHAHAWFAGYLQATDAAGHPNWAVAPRIAFAVLVEFGGSGGREAGPVAQRVARTTIEVLGAKLDPDAVIAEDGAGRLPAVQSAGRAP